MYKVSLPRRANKPLFLAFAVKRMILYFSSFRRYAKENGGYKGVKFNLDDPTTDAEVRQLTEKFEAWPSLGENLYSLWGHP